MGITNSNKELSAARICNARNFKARFIAHYVDHDFDCCDLIL